MTIPETDTWGSGHTVRQAGQLKPLVGVDDGLDLSVRQLLLLDARLQKWQGHSQGLGFMPTLQAGTLVWAWQEALKQQNGAGLPPALCEVIGERLT